MVLRLPVLALLLFTLLLPALAGDATGATGVIDALAADPRVQSAFRHIEENGARANADMIELTEIPAPPFREQARAARFADMLREAGVDRLEIDAAGNVIGWRSGTDAHKIIAVAAHLDTVFPEGTDVTVKVEGDRYTAPGIGDNTRGLVVVLEVLRAMNAARIETRATLLFIGNVGEEGLGDLKGVKHLFRDGGPGITSFIAIDGGKPERLINGAVGSHRYRVTFSGPGGHSWSDFGMANPHHALGRAIALFDDAAPEVTSGGVKTSYNIGRVGGGTSINSLPFSSWMEVDMRSISQEKLDAIDAVLRRTVGEALRLENEGRAKGPELTVDVARVGTRPAGAGDPDAALTGHAMAALRHLGITPELRRSSTDANIPISLGIPAVTISRGGLSGGAHSPDEWWEDVDAHIGPELALLILLAEAGIVEDGRARATAD